LELKQEFSRSKDRIAIDFRDSNNWIPDEIAGDHPDAWVICGLFALLFIALIAEDVAAAIVDNP
ncbi:MAG: hypothetical protein IJV05_03550, partial [Muribaculaceae bacterium]|nr:hypothetical protein [Muribaculaceae bacterium]